jgi:hypothetical protein
LFCKHLLLEFLSAISFLFNQGYNNLLKKASQLAHLNTQTFDEFQFKLKEYSFDIFTMSETWLKNNPHLLKYVEHPGFNCLFRKRETVCGGGVGVYLRDHINFKRRTDIEKKGPLLEHLWIEEPGRDKHSKLLLGTIFRSERILDFNTDVG